ncbi:UDP-4-amino-4,6-dideoxy-N-acetyl-beta-L-altrosamine transaminase [bacterium]|nr:UDP-4-amino-4,6-dideoxy-N-acetyl-beta-L-altrosamine transaminase [bacterium]
MNNFLPYGRHNIREKDIQKVIEVLRSDYLTQGPKVPAFEKAISKKFNVLHAIASNSATSSLHLACLALGLKENDYFWTSATTFVASANCGLYCSAKIDFVDINPNNGLMDIEKLKRKLKKAEIHRKIPKILIPVHLAGSSCEMKEIYKLSEKYGFKIIEDASHAVGGSYLNQPIGSCQFSSICIFSFHPVKIITTGEGGIATTNSSLLANKMSQLRSHGITKDSNNFIYKPDGIWSYEQQLLGFNYRMNDISAALGISQLDRLEFIIKERNKLFNNYKELIKDLPCSLLEIPLNVYSSLHLAIIRLNNSNPSFHSNIFNGMRSFGIGVQVHYTPVHLQPYYRQFGFKEGDFPESEKYSKSCFSIPIYPEITFKDQIFIINKLESLIYKYK